jgi:hypothetical protein
MKEGAKIAVLSDKYKKHKHSVGRGLLVNYVTSSIIVHVGI